MCSQQRLLIDSRKTQESLMNNYLSGPLSLPLLVCLFLSLYLIELLLHVRSFELAA